MRIVYILTTLGIGGAEKQVISLAERMAAKGHTVTFLILKHSTSEEWPVKLPVMRLNMEKTPRSLWRGLRFGAQFLSIFRPDVVHSHTFPANIFARLLRMHGLKASSINTIHNVYEGGWHRTLIYRLTDRYVDQITAVSSAVAERFIHAHTATAKKISVITNGIDTGAFVPDPRRRDSTRKKMQVASSFIWLAVGRLAPAKDYPNLLRAFAIIQETHSDAALWIAGEGDLPEVETTAAMIPNVHILGLRTDIPALLDAADGYVLSSAWEGMPLSVGEAMAMQKTIVATDVGGVRELVGGLGQIVPSKDSESLANAMSRAMTLTNKQRRETGRAERERIEFHYSIDAKAEEWLKLYHSLIQGNT